MFDHVRRGTRCIALLMCGGLAWRPSFAQVSCPDTEVREHVRMQFLIYGPLSKGHEFFGFIYLQDGVVRSSIVEGGRCAPAVECTIDTRRAAVRIPKGVKILGEWHTHPTGDGSNYLSKDDVRGARNQRAIRCYMAFYGASNGNFYSWKPDSTSVPTAMNSRVLWGNYRSPELLVQTAVAADEE